MSLNAHDYAAHGILNRVEEREEIIRRHRGAECLPRLFYCTIERKPDSHRKFSWEAPLCVGSYRRGGGGGIRISRRGKARTHLIDLELDARFRELFVARVVPLDKAIQRCAVNAGQPCRLRHVAASAVNHA